MPTDIQQFLRQAAERRAAGRRVSPPQPEPATLQPIETDDDGTDRFSQRAAQMGEQFGRSDDKMASHMHETFDHDLGQLQHSDTLELESIEEGLDIAGMLKNPQSMRQAIILNEILKRPEW